MWRGATSAAAAAAIAAGCLPAGSVQAETPMSAPAPERPTILFNRWQEDWSVLADPGVPREPLDRLKYIPWSQSDPKTYLSFGAGLRERFESNDAPMFGVGGAQRQAYVISRAELHADLHVASWLQAFVQLQSDFAPWKKPLTPVDQNRLDLEQGFVAVTRPLDGGTLKLRLGRQQFAFDLQRFVSVRDGPNVRQSFDAGWADYERGAWRLIGFYGRPVQNRDGAVFDDFSSDRLTYGGLRVERKLSEKISLSAYYSRFSETGARYLTASGDERRDNFDIHLFGTDGRFDFDAEAMFQTGRVGRQDVSAWAVGSIWGYGLADVTWAPRIGLQVDAASGDRDPGDGRLQTFNPLFPNGAYLSLAGYTGYVNFIQVKPSLTLHPAKPVKLMLAVAPQWRQTTDDAVYTQPDSAVPGTAGQPGLYTGTYDQARLDWALSRTTSFAVEAVHFHAGEVIRRAGGRDANYLGVQISRGW